MLSRMQILVRSAKLAAPEIRSTLLSAHLHQQPLAVTSVQQNDMSTEAEADVSRVRELHTDQEVESVMKAAVHSNALSVFDFTAAWCGPCRVIKPIYDELSQDCDDVDFYKIDVDKPEVHQSVAAAGVAALPTFAFFRGGKKVAMFSGADKQQLKNNVVNLRAMGA